MSLKDQLYQSFLEQFAERLFERLNALEQRNVANVPSLTDDALHERINSLTVRMDEAQAAAKAMDEKFSGIVKVMTSLTDSVANIERTIEKARERQRIKDMETAEKILVIKNSAEAAAAAKAQDAPKQPTLKEPLKTFADLGKVLKPAPHIPVPEQTVEAVPPIQANPRYAGDDSLLLNPTTGHVAKPGEWAVKPDLLGIPARIAAGMREINFGEHRLRHMANFIRRTGGWTRMVHDDDRVIRTPATLTVIRALERLGKGKELHPGIIINEVRKEQHYSTSTIYRSLLTLARAGCCTIKGGTTWLTKSKMPPDGGFTFTTRLNDDWPLEN